MAGPLIVCPSCSTHVLVRHAGCPHCGATVRSGGEVLGRTAGAVLMGLALAGCPASDDTSETMGNGDTSSGTTTQPTSSTTDDSGSTSTFDASSGPVGEAYGSPETSDSLGTSSGGDTSTGTGTGSGDTDTDTDGTTGGAGTDSASSTGISPDYGVPTTGE